MAQRQVEGLGRQKTALHGEKNSFAADRLAHPRRVAGKQRAVSVTSTHGEIDGISGADLVYRVADRQYFFEIRILWQTSGQQEIVDLLTARQLGPIDRQAQTCRAVAKPDPTGVAAWEKVNLDFPSHGVAGAQSRLKADASPVH